MSIGSVRWMIGAALVACSGEGGGTPDPTETGDDTGGVVDPPPEASLFVTDSVVRLQEDDTVGLVLEAELLNSERRVVFEILTPPSFGRLVGAGSVYEYLPNEHFNGTDRIVWRAFVGDELEAEATIELIVEPVNDAPRGQALVLTTEEDTPIEGSLPVSDVEGDPLVFEIVDNPTSGSVSLGVDGTFTYTPTLDFFGNDAFTWAARDPEGASSGPVQVDVTVTSANDAPVAVSAQLSTLEEQPITSQLVASDADGDPLVWAIVASPTNGTLSADTNSGSFTYTPERDFFGTDSFDFVANDGITDSFVATVTIDVTNVNDAPTGLMGQTLSTVEDVPVSGVVTATDPDGDPISYRIGTGPRSGDLDLDPGTGAFTYTPARDFNGIDDFTVIASDGQLETLPARLTIQVSAVNDPPAIVPPGLLSTPEDQPLSGQLVATDPEGDSLTWRVVRLPDDGALLFSTVTGAFTYEPDPDTNGPDSFDVVVSDGLLDSAVVTVAIDVGGTNDAPEFPAGLALVTDEDVALADTVVAVDVDGDAITYRVDEAPALGVVFLDPVTGDFTYTPLPDRNGVDDFTVIASDGVADSLPSRVTITVVPINDPPTVQSASFSTDEDTALADMVAFGDVDGDPVTVALDQAPWLGTVTVDPTGGFLYTPNPNVSGSDAFTVLAIDGVETSNAALISISIVPVNDPPVPVPASLTLVSDTTAQVTLAASDVEGDTLTFTITQLPTNGAATLDPTTRVLEYTPNPGYLGSDALIWSVSDGQVAVPTVLPIVVSSDTDGDGIADPVDNCPDVANPAQDDASLNGVGDACDCYAVPFGASLDPTFWATSTAVTPVTSPVSSPTHALQLDGDNAFVQSVQLPGCPSFRYALSVAAGSPAPEAADALDLSVRKDGGPWITLDSALGAQLTTPFATVLDGQTQPVVDLSGGQVEVRIEVIGDEPDDIFVIDDLVFECDTDVDELGDCVEWSLPGFDPTQSDADGDGLLDGAEFALGTDPNLPDTDSDGVNDPVDNCPVDANPTQVDSDGDGIGDACDPTP